MYRFGEGTFISMILPASKNPVTPTIRKKFPNRNWTKISGSLESIFQGYVGELLIQLYCYLGGGFNFFNFHFSPLFGEDSHFDEHIFQMGGSTTNQLLLLQRFNMKTPPTGDFMQFHHSGSDVAIRAVPMWVVKVSVTWRLQLSDHLFFFNHKNWYIRTSTKGRMFSGGKNI